MEINSKCHFKSKTPDKLSIAIKTRRKILLKPLEKTDQTVDVFIDVIQEDTFERTHGKKHLNWV